MRVRGRSEFFLPSYTRCARSISMLRTFREGIHLERLTLRKPATSEPSAPSGNPTSLTLFLLLLSSISVIFSVSRSSWFLKSVTVLLSSRAAAWTESTRSCVCFVALASASSSALSSLTELLVACMSACMSARSSRNAGVSTESTASLTVEATAESKVLCCSLRASLIPLAIASSRSSLENLWIFSLLAIAQSLFSDRLWLLKYSWRVRCKVVRNLLTGLQNNWQSQQSERLRMHRSRRVTWSSGMTSLDKNYNFLNDLSGFIWSLVYVMAVQEPAL